MTCLQILPIALVLAPCVSLLAQPHAEWSVEPVVTSISPSGTSLAFAPDGTAWVSFRSVNEDGLVVARRSGVAWTAAIVDAASGTGHSSSLAIDSLGNPAVSYYDAGNADLKFARFDGTTWHVETVDSTGSVGLYTSLKFAPSGQPVIAYKANTNDDLKLAEWNGSSWVVTNVPVAGLIGSFASLAFTPGGEPAVAYFDSGASDLEYVVRSSGTWTMTSIDTAGNVGRYASLAFGPDGQPAIGYHDQTNGWLKFARFDGTSWNVETVDSAGVVGTDVSLKFAPGGQPAMSYYDISNSALKYAVHDGSVWQKITVTNDGSVGVFSSLAFAPNGEPSISFADSPSGVSLASHIPPVPVITYVGPAGGLWDDSLNWSPRPPTTGDEVQIQTGSAVLLTGGSHTVGRLVLDGTLTVSGGTLEVAGQVSGSGELIISGGTFEAAGQSSSLGSLTVSGGTVNFGSATTLSGALVQSAGTLTAEGTLIVTGGGEWSGGTWTGSGSVEVRSTFVISGTGVVHMADGVQIITAGTAQWTQGDITLTGGSTWTHDGTGDFVWSSGGLWTSGENELLYVQGRVLVQGGGALWQGSGHWMSTGTLEVSGAFVTGSGDLLMEGSVLITGTGQIELSGGVVHVEGGQLITQGTLEWSGGTLDVTSSGTVEVAGGAVWTVTGGGQLVSDGSGTLEVGGTFTVEGGQWVSEEGIVILQGGSMEVPGGEVILTRDVQVLQGGTVMIEGTGTVSLMMAEMVLQDGATLEGDGTIELNGGYYQTVGGARYLVMSDGTVVLMHGPPGCLAGQYDTGAGQCLPCPSYAAGAVIPVDGYWVSAEGDGGAFDGGVCSAPRVNVGSGAVVVDYIGDIAIGSAYSQVVGGDAFPPQVDVLFQESATIEVGAGGIHFPPRNLIWGAEGRWDVRVRDPLATGLPGAGIPGIDQIHTTGSITLGATPAAPFVISLHTQDGAGSPGPLPDYDPGTPWSILLVLGTVSGDLGNIRIETTRWLNDRRYGHLGLERRADGIYLVHTPSPFQLWLAQHFNVAERADPALTSLTSDSDGDGDSLLLEFLRQQNPRAADPLPISAGFLFSEGGNILRVPVLSEAGRGMAVELQTSPDLAVWTTRGTLAPDGTFTQGASELGNSSTAIPGGMEHKFDLSLTSSQFLQLKITPADPWWDGPGLPPAGP